MIRNILSISLLFCMATMGRAQSLTLQDCRRMALEYNEELKTAGNAVVKAKLDRKIAFAQYLPKFDVSGTALLMKDQDLGPLTLQIRGTYMAGINLTLPIYAGGQLTSANKLARLNQDVTAEQQRKTRMQVIANVDNAYYALVSVHSKVQMLEAYARQMQGLYDQVSVSVSAQLATTNDLLRVSTKQNEVSYQLQKARNGEQLCRLALANVIGMDDANFTIDSLDMVNTLNSQRFGVGVPLDEDISQRPELHLLQQQVRAGELQVKQTRSNYLPTVALIGHYSYYNRLKLKGNLPLDDGSYINLNETFHGFSPMAMLTVRVPVFHWGAEVRKVKKAKITLEDYKLQLQEYERGMRIEVRQAVLNLTDGQRMLQTATIGQQQADENLRVMRQRFDNQLCTMTDMLDAESQWQQARSNFIEAQTQQKINETEYLRVTGRLE